MKTVQHNLTASGKIYCMPAYAGNVAVIGKGLPYNRWDFQA